MAPDGVLEVQADGQDGAYHHCELPSCLVSTFIFASVLRPRLVRRAEVGRGKDGPPMDRRQREPRSWAGLQDAVHQHRPPGPHRSSGEKQSGAAQKRGDTP